MSLTPVLAGIVAAACVLALLRRWDVWRWLAVLAAVPPVVAASVVPAGGAGAVGGSSTAALTTVSVGLLLLGWRARRSRLGGAGVGLLALALLAAARQGPSEGPVLGLAGWLLLGAAAALGLAAAMGLGRAHVGALRLLCGAAVLAPLAVVVVGALRASGPPPFETLLVALAWWPAAGALGLTALLRGRRSAASARAQLDAVDEEALADFWQRYGEPRLAPVVVVIAAYDEGGGIAGVLDSLPRELGGLPVDVVVVDDGSSDDTAAQVEAAGRAHLVRCPRNRGQGAALRLGYLVARRHGADYLVTTDADGQYEAADMEALLTPLTEGRADFVTGSRLLGRQETRDRVRRLGVHVFAWVLSALVGRRVTDTSFGLRAMRAHVSAAVTLNQPQYQSSELLLGVFSHGFEVLEVPATMNVRSAGASKKGGNWRYGRSYAQVVLGTWWREGCPAPVVERAAACRDLGGAATG